jgi:hypothetical protein
MRLKTLVAGFAFALTATAALAAYNNVVVKLKTPVAEATNSVIVLGAAWSCAGDTCTSVLDRKTPQVRDCRQVARALGPVASFSVGGASLDEAGIQACNTAAK